MHRQHGQTQVGAISCANQSFPGQQATDDRFARCLGVPVSQVAMLAGNDEPGEPFSYSSSTYTAPGGSEAKINDSPPTAQSLLTIEKSAPVQKADLAAFSRASFQSLLEGRRVRGRPSHSQPAQRYLPRRGVRQLFASPGVAGCGRRARGRVPSQRGVQVG